MIEISGERVRDGQACVPVRRLREKGLRQVSQARVRPFKWAGVPVSPIRIFFFFATGAFELALFSPAVGGISGLLFWRGVSGQSAPMRFYPLTPPPRDAALSEAGPSTAIAFPG